MGGEVKKTEKKKGGENYIGTQLLSRRNSMVMSAVCVGGSRVRTLHRYFVPKGGTGLNDFQNLNSFGMMLALLRMCINIEIAKHAAHILFR